MNFSGAKIQIGGPFEDFLLILCLIQELPFSIGVDATLNSLTPAIHATICLTNGTESPVIMFKCSAHHAAAAGGAVTRLTELQL